MVGHVVHLDLGLGREEAQVVKAGDFDVNDGGQVEHDAFSSGPAVQGSGKRTGVRASVKDVAILRSVQEKGQHNKFRSAPKQRFNINNQQQQQQKKKKKKNTNNASTYLAPSHAVQREEKQSQAREQLHLARGLVCVSVGKRNRLTFPFCGPQLSLHGAERRERRKKRILISCPLPLIAMV
jgi:hypothetical protein